MSCTVVISYCAINCFLIFQIDAHIGGVNDIAFAHPNKQLCIVTCGDDKIIKVLALCVVRLYEKKKLGILKIIFYSTGLGCCSWTQAIYI